MWSGLITVKPTDIKKVTQEKHNKCRTADTQTFSKTAAAVVCFFYLLVCY